jgi:hypothetical protein
MLSVTLSSARGDDRPIRSTPAKGQNIGYQQSDGAVSMIGPFISELNANLVPRSRDSEEPGCLGPSLGATDESIASLAKGCAPFYSPPLCAACIRGSYKEMAWFKCLECLDNERESIWFMLLLVFGTLAGMIAATVFVYDFKCVVSRMIIMSSLFEKRNEKQPLQPMQQPTTKRPTAAGPRMSTSSFGQSVVCGRTVCLPIPFFVLVLLCFQTVGYKHV